MLYNPVRSCFLFHLSGPFKGMINVNRGRFTSSNGRTVHDQSLRVPRYLIIAIDRTSPTYMIPSHTRMLYTQTRIIAGKVSRPRHSLRWAMIDCICAPRESRPICVVDKRSVHYSSKHCTYVAGAGAGQHRLETFPKFSFCALPSIIFSEVDGVGSEVVVQKVLSCTGGGLHGWP